jgi:Na+/H+ antiporter NhaD/arsenite permease-like protein
MIISSIIITGCFMGVIILILTERLNRAIAALTGATITYFVLIFIERMKFSVIVDLLFGTEDDGFVNLHSLILIIGMMFIVSISNEAGLFQFLAIKLIKLSKGKPIRLMIILCLLCVFISAILNNILAVIILIPLTITVSRILNIDPTPYILTEAIIVNLGGSIFLISSIPNILIATYAGITFLEFFLNVGLISLIILIFTLLYFVFLYKKELVIPKEGVSVLGEFNVWNLVQNKPLMYECIVALSVLMVLFIIIPSSIITPDMIALSIALTLIILSRLEPKDLISKIDYELIFYLLGIFIIAGALEALGLLAIIGRELSGLGGGDLLIQMILILWISAFLSSTIDNIPITKILIPVIGTMSSNGSTPNKNQLYYSLAIGANWGDNLTPLGDNILVMNISEQHKRSLSFKLFFKLGFSTTIYQLAIVTLIYVLLFQFYIGVSIILIVSFMVAIIYITKKLMSKSIGQKIDVMVNKFRILIIK